MKTNETGGSAFPSKFAIQSGSLNPITGKNVPTGHTEIYVEMGMTVRDYFAAHAPINWQDAIESLDCTNGERTGPWPGSKIIERLVLLRNDFADAMLRARQQPAAE